MREASKPHSALPESVITELREIADHIEEFYPASAGDLREHAEWVAGLFEQLEAEHASMEWWRDRANTLEEQLQTAEQLRHDAVSAYRALEVSYADREEQLRDMAVDILREARTSYPASVPEREGGEQNPTSALSPTPNSIRQRAEGESRSETSAEQSPASEPEGE